MEKFSPIKRMMLFCEPCGFKQIIEPDKMPTDICEIKTSPIQQQIPILDVGTNKTVTKPFKPQPKKYKCPSCGRGVRLKELLKPYADSMNKVDEENHKKTREEQKKKRIADGQPEKKKPDPNFTG